MSSKKSIPPESIIRDIKRKTRRKFTAEKKICIVLEGLRKSEDIGSGVRRSIQMLKRGTVSPTVSPSRAV